MPTYSVNVVAYGSVLVQADNEEEAMLMAMDADVSRFQIDEAKDAYLLTTDEEIKTAKRHGAQVML